MWVGAEAYPYVLLTLRVFVVILTLPFGAHYKLLPRLVLTVGLVVAFSSHLPIQLAPHLGALTLDTGATGVVRDVTVEIVMGLLIALPTRLFVEGGYVVGELIDTSRGQTIGSVQDPLHGPSSSDLAVICRLGGTVLFTSCGGLELVVRALSQSVATAPPSSFTSFVDLIAELLSKEYVVQHFSVVGSLIVVWVVPFIAVDLLAVVCHRLCSHFTFSVTSGVIKTVITFLLVTLLFTEGRGSQRLWLQVVVPTLPGTIPDSGR